MNKINILITGIGGDIAQGIIKCIKDMIDYNLIIGCDIDLYPAGKAFVDIFYQASKANHNSYTQLLQNICEKHDINYIIPTTEQEIKYFNNNRDKFNGINVLINNKFIIDTFMDKFKTIEFLKKNNLPHPATFKLNNYKYNLEFPVIVKNIFSQGSKGVQIIHTRKKFDSLNLNQENTIVQQYIGNGDVEYTMCVFSDGNNTYTIAFRRLLGLGSLSRFVELVYIDELDKLGKSIATLINLKGSINVQLRKHDNKFIPFEINPRISSTVAFRHVFGFCDVVWWINTISNTKEIIYTPKYKHGIGVKTVSEVFFDMEKY